jgi:hypothetical protein
VFPEVPATADFCAIAGDPLALALDGQSFLGVAQPWTARVHGVYRDDGSCWIQVSKDGDAAASVLVRCSRFATAAHVRAALAGWVPAPARSLNVLPAMAVA